MIPRVNLTIKIIGKSIPDIMRDFKTSHFELQSEIRELGESTQREMANMILAGKKRPTISNSGKSKLEDNIDLEHQLNADGVPGAGWGLGLIGKLNSEFPYWKAINWGSRHLVDGQVRVPSGKFSPGAENPNQGSFRAGQWQDGGNYSFIPKKQIYPINFLEKTQHFLGLEISRILATHTSKFK